jgi:hypothetical protein
MPTRHRFHGSSERFEALADYIAKNFKDLRYIADVAGGQGMLSRLLNKRGFESEVIDPRGWTMVGVRSRPEEYSADMADYYDLVVGLHPDEATRPVVESAKVRPVIVIPCCNFWNREVKLGRDALLDEIEEYFKASEVSYEKVVFDFKGPKNIGFVTRIK